MAKYSGSCHCGKAKFEAEGEMKQVMSCNCSICRRKGWLMWFVPRDRFRLTTPEASLKTYEFNKHVIKHKFCPDCGMNPFAEGVDKSGNKHVAVNVRCLDGVDLEKLEVKSFNGAAL